MPDIPGLAATITQAKTDAYTLAATTSTTTAQWLKQCWEQLDAALWSCRQADPTIPNPQPDLRNTVAAPVVPNPIDAPPQQPRQS